MRRPFAPRFDHAEVRRATAPRVDATAAAAAAAAAAATPRPRPRRPAPRGRAAVVILVVITLFAVVGGGAWWWLAQGRLPLAGGTSHDFGTVLIQGDEVLLAHEFELVNRRSEPVRIVRAVASCGCAGVEYDEDPIAPGESVTVLGRLALEQSGPRSANVALILDNGERQRLFLEGVGRKERLVRLEPSRISLPAEGTAQVLVQARILREEGGEPVEPPVPVVDVPEQVEAEWLGWAFMEAGEPSLLTADGWRGRVALRWTGQDLDPGAAVVVTLPSTVDGEPDIRARCFITGVRQPPPAAPGLPGPVPAPGAETGSDPPGGSEPDPLAAPLPRVGTPEDG